MKQKISITIDEQMIQEIQKALANAGAKFRNRSHVIEYSLAKMFEENNLNKQRIGGN
jgi:Arc/MetJ-type ribon-helix-helix transcriptional regulator